MATWNPDFQGHHLKAKIVMISVEINADEISAALANALTLLDDMAPIMNKVGAMMRDQKST